MVEARRYSTVFITALLALPLLMISNDGHAQNALKTPNISANALFLYRNSNQDTPTNRNGPDIEEGEIEFYSDVDPYSRLFMVLTVLPNYTQNGGNVQETWLVEPEELYAESNEVPRFTFKIGKFKAAFGKHNLLHTHAFPFIDVPLAHHFLLGTEDEGLNDVGVSAAYLIPTSWFSEFTLQLLRAEDTNTEFNPPSSNTLVTLGHYKNLWDITDALTGEVGLSAAGGANNTNSYTNLQGVDLTFKWRPVNGGMYRSAILGFEYLRRTMGEGFGPDEVDSGGNVWFQYQFAQRWLANVRFDYLDVSNAFAVPGDASTPLVNQTSERYTAGVTFNATEFSQYRLEYYEQHGEVPLPNLGDEKRIYLLGNFTIGSHPAHSY